MNRIRFVPTAAILAITAASLGADFAFADRGPQLFATSGNVAIVDISGPLVQHAERWCPWDSYDAIRGRVDAALASPCDVLVLRIDSPGGSVAGCFELSRAIAASTAKAGKSVVAYVDGCACSAAYALACAASSIFVPPTAILGSIGVIKVAVDQTALNASMGLAFSVVTSGARKADGVPMVPITKEAIAAFQVEVDAMASLFFDLVSEARGMKPEAVEALEAGTFIGAQAVSAGLADEVITFEGLLANLANGQKTALAGAEVPMARAEIIAALKAQAKDGSDDEKTEARAALKAMGEGDEEKNDDKKDDAKADSPPPADDKKDDKKEPERKDDDAKALHALAAQVQGLSAQIQRDKDTAERRSLMASRPDFVPEVVAYLDKQPLSAVRDAVAQFPKGAPVAKGQVAAARAALSTTATLGSADGTGDHLPPDQAHELDIRMGLAVRNAQAVRHEGNLMIMGVITPAQARAEIARKAAAK